MTLQVTGKNVDAGGAFQEYINDKITSVLDKYIGPEIAGHVRLEKERTGFRTDCSIRLQTGLLLEAHGVGEDAYASADAAIDRLETRVRRYKRKLKSHHSGRDAQPSGMEFPAREHVVQIDQQESDTDTHENPVIVAENQFNLSELAVSEAVMHLDLTENPFLIFRNAASGSINVVYRRKDGNIGWVDPSNEPAAVVNSAATTS